MKSNTKSKLSQVSFAVLLCFSALSENAIAEEEVLPEYTFLDAIKAGKSLSSIRPRYEHVDQTGFGQAPLLTHQR